MQSSVILSSCFRRRAQADYAVVAPPRATAYLPDMATLAPEIILTPSAAARVAAIASKQGKPAILRLSVDGGGCSGFQYK